MTTSRTGGEERLASRVTILGFLLALGAIAVLLVIPFGTTCTAEAVSVGATPKEPVCRAGPTLLATEGPTVLGLLAIPGALAGFPLVGGRRSAPLLRAISAVLLMTFCILGMFSVGLFFVPAALAMVVAATLDRRRAERSSVSSAVV